MNLTQVRPSLKLQVQLICKFSSTCKINLVFKIDESTAIVIGDERSRAEAIKKTDLLKQQCHHVYVAQCSLCEGKHIDSAYVGQTQQRFHQRANGHWSCFVADEPDTIDKSVLALHHSC